MAQRKKWNIEKKERLFKVAARYADALAAAPYVIDENTEVIRNIHAAFNDSGSDPRAVLFQLEKMKFVKTKGDSRKLGIFYRQDPHFRVEDLTICVDYADASQDELNTLVASLPGHYAAGCTDVADLCTRLHAAGGRTELNYKKILFHNGIAELSADGRARLTPSHASGIPLPLTRWTQEREAPKHILAEIYTYRGRAGRYYDALDHPLPALIRSTDGTGFGKSYAVVARYLDSVKQKEPNVKHRNLLFITPQKTQIDIDRGLLDQARLMGVPCLPMLSRQDIADPQFIDWVTKESNRDKYQRWSKEGRGAHDLQDHLERLCATLEQIEVTSKQLADESSYAEEPHLRHQLLQLRNRFLRILEDTALAALNQNGSHTSIGELSRRNGRYDALRLEIISRVLPLERSLHEPCILLATTKKFDRQMPVLRKGRSGGYTIKLADLYELIGGCQHAPGLITSAAVALAEPAQRAFLREQMFVEDPDSMFRAAKVAFTVAIDEEHEAYKILSGDRKISLLDAKSNLPHVLSTVCRVYKSIGGGNAKIGMDRPLYEVARAFFDRMEELLREKCELSPGQTLLSLISLFESNIGHVQIDKREVEQVINVTRNVFNFTPKRFFNEGALKKLRMRSCDGNTYCQIYFGNEEDTDPTLHDLFQLIMALLSAASEVKGEDFLRMLGSKESGSQNALLGDFIKRARKQVEDVQYLFDRSVDEDQVVNKFFTYFQPKTVFSIVPRETVYFNDVRLRDYVYADFRMDLLLELPEVSLMRMAHNTLNAVYCLSATTGFHSVYNGNYNYNVLRYYGELGNDTLGYKVIRRSEDDILVLKNLRDARAAIRSVTFSSFPSDRPSIMAGDGASHVAKLVKDWAAKLDPNKYMRRNPYHQRELLRQLEAIMLASHDKKNTLVLSLSGGLGNLFRDFLDKNHGTTRHLRRVQPGVDDIYDFTPMENGVTLRLIFFHSPLAKQVNVRDFTELHSESQRLVMVSSYVSAGTGLNYFVTYEGTPFREDFARLVLVNSPFYSEVIQPDKGLNSLDNWLTLMKFYADSKQIKYLRDFDVNLITGDNYAVLMREHDMSLFKTLMQALGRVERADSLLISEVFICSDLLDIATLRFEQLGRANNEIVLGSMSLLNTSLRDHCRGLAKQQSFTSAAERASFERDIAERQDRIEEFFSKFLRSEIVRARNGNREAAELNETFRSMDCVFKPEKWLSDLKGHASVASDRYRCATIEDFYIHRTGHLEHVTLCVDQARATLTDIVGGIALYRPERQVLPSFDKDLGPAQGDFWTRYWKLVGYMDEAFKAYIPLPAMLPLIKGNVGEYLLDALLDHLEQPALSVQMVFDKLSPRCYELFDRYVEVDNTLICIDAKYWTAIFDRAELAQETHQEALRKMVFIRDLLGKNYDGIKFVYLNTRVENNPLNLSPEVDCDGAHYLNLVQRENGYEKSKDKQYVCNLTSSLVLNRRLTDMLSPARKTS
ncbi:hypothetical protein [Massilia sp. erpn]|uniref:hypothetical protein n=1 Tax=Massilia sp. erpn TaxID=2738142 RepID=UPI002107E4AA|nr:hypothetical protein [Massilia sp. erpn]UTY59485.1 hypothetical protein HPQ68_21295 [Massilia sp. erpn]